ncbi:disease resistance protein RPP13-like [Vigna radiata var. radiata]|uniref:Disease resistance protein RPP13-like n=1 Tax=Vigna radiata var. radiata TaxID=3916 RepID=A0A1S3VWM7_VIGRR|nr:disease resistance protein RPP13-like [Vigna radiata var. radiata]
MIKLQLLKVFIYSLQLEPLLIYTFEYSFLCDCKLHSIAFFWCLSKSLLVFFHHQPRTIIQPQIQIYTLLHAVMADSVVSFVLDHLAQLAAREANLLYGVEDRVQSLQYELQMIKDLLNTTKRKKGMEHTVLDQIRDVAHLAEDVIDTFVAKVSVYKRRTILGRMLRGFGQVRLLHHVADKIDKLKTTLNEIRDNKNKYDAFKETTDQSAVEEEEKERLQLLHELRRDVEEENVVGFVDDSKDVVQRLLRGGSNREVVSVVGMGGLGKTTLARKVYNSSQVVNHFDCHAWVYVSNECRVHDLLIDLLKHLMPIFEQQLRGNKSAVDIKDLSKEELKKHVWNYLERKRYLVVVDDLWKRRDWDEVKDAFPDNNRGSRILITSRLKEVALHAGDDVPHHLQFLSEEESWELFCRKAFRGKNCPSDLEPLGKQMVQSCRGLPLSIIVLGGLLANKEKSDREWSKVVGHVNWYLTRDETQVKDIVLKLSYDNLPRRLKPCFLYLGLFPEDFKIPVTPLLQKWVAEGFIQDTGNRDPDDVAEDYLYELIDRSLVQVARMDFNGGLKTCQVHDLLRDLCISESKEDKMFEVCTNNNILLRTKPRRLSIHIDTGHYISSSNNDHSCIRSLFFFGPGYHVRGREWKWLLDDFKLVRVLEFGPYDRNKIPSNLGNFIHLRYLRIKDVFVYSIPDSILNLWNLQTIDLGSWEGLMPVSFPIQMWKLKHLRHLNTQGPIKLRGRCSPSSYEKMWNLQTISLVLNMQATSLIKKGTFPNIKWLRLKEEYGFVGELPNLSQNLELNHLNKLLILSPFRRGHKLQEQLQSLGQLSCLTILIITDVLDLLTSTLILPPNITELTLSGIKCITDEGMNSLANHSKLKVLRLRGKVTAFEDSVDLNCADGGFPQLEVFKMRDIKLRKWRLGNCAMQKLQNVFILDCRPLDHLPTELCSLNELREVHITEYPSKQMTHILEILKTNNGVRVIIGIFSTPDVEWSHVSGETYEIYYSK